MLLLQRCSAAAVAGVAVAGVAVVAVSIFTVSGVVVAAVFVVVVVVVVGNSSCVFVCGVISTSCIWFDCEGGCLGGERRRKRICLDGKRSREREGGRKVIVEVFSCLVSCAWRQEGGCNETLMMILSKSIIIILSIEI